MDAKTAAERLHGMEYGDERKFGDLFAAMKDAGLIAITGSSDDLIEFYGAFREECGLGDDISLMDGGLFQNECEDEDCPYFRKLAKQAHKLKADFGDHPEWTDNPAWIFELDVPHETFDVMEEGEVFSRGLVLSTGDIS